MALISVWFDRKNEKENSQESVDLFGDLLVDGVPVDASLELVREQRVEVSSGRNYVWKKIINKSYLFYKSDRYGYFNFLRLRYQVKSYVEVG